MKDRDGNRCGALLGLALVLLLASAGAAEARDITVRWRYAAPERIAGFRLHVGPAPGQYTRTIDVGKPRPDADGVFRVHIEVPDHDASFVAVTAYDGRGAESPHSNETVRASATERPEGAAPAGLSTPGRPEVVRP